MPEHHSYDYNQLRWSTHDSSYLRLCTAHIMPQPKTACTNVRYAHSTGVRMGAPLFLTNTTSNFAGSVLLALRPTT